MNEWFLQITTSLVLIIITFFTQKTLNNFTTKQDKYNKKMEASTNGTKVLLWAELARTHKKCTEGGFCTLEEKVRIKNLYSAYHEMGGNGVGTRLYEELLHLPNERKIDD